ALQMSVLDGHVYLPLDECVASMQAVLRADSVTEDMILEQIEQLSNEKVIILKDGFVYLKSLYYAEDQFSSHIKRILDKSIDTNVTDAELMKLIGEIE